jgi:hypothetical protein
MLLRANSPIRTMRIPAVSISARSWSHRSSSHCSGYHVEHEGTYYLLYNAKTRELPKAQGGGWREQTGVATSKDLKRWARYEHNPIVPNGAHGSWDERFASTLPAIISTFPTGKYSKRSSFLRRPLFSVTIRGLALSSATLGPKLDPSPLVTGPSCRDRE